MNTYAKSCFLFFFFNYTATTEIYTLSLHDALPICAHGAAPKSARRAPGRAGRSPDRTAAARAVRSEEHTSELQSPCNLVCRLLLEKKKKITSMSSRIIQPYQLLSSLLCMPSSLFRY